MKPVLLSLLLLSSATNIDAQRIDISTSKTDLILKVGDNKTPLPNLSRGKTTEQVRR